MTQFTNHGTSWSETESLMDVIELYNEWDGSSVPDFTAARRRLHETFETGELETLSIVLETLKNLINHELTWRERDVAEGSSEPQA